MEITGNMSQHGPYIIVEPVHIWWLISASLYLILYVETNSQRKGDLLKESVKELVINSGYYFLISGIKVARLVYI